MKKTHRTLILLLITTAILLFPSYQSSAANGNSPYYIEENITFNSSDISFEKLMGYDKVQISDCYNSAEPGNPMLPLREIKVAIPSGMSITGVHLVSFEKSELSGRYNIFPAQPPRHIGDKFDRADFINPDDNIYSSSAPYPEKVVELIRETDLAGQPMAVVLIHPIEYIPAKGQLSLYTSITFAIEGTDGYNCGDYLPISISDKSISAREKLVEELVINPEDVSLTANLPANTGVEPGRYDYVIITSSNWVDDFQSLADWKNKKGLPAKIVTTDWIYNNGGYSGSDADKIRAFVSDAYSNWGMTYLLLGGDTNIIPYGVANYNGDNIPNDTYYGDFDDDFINEVYVGRASVTNTSQVSTFINKVMTYETNPPTNYIKKVGMFGFDLDDSTPGEDCKRYINNHYIPPTWTKADVFDSDGGNHRDNVISAINDGQNLINHIDHCNQDFIGTGYINHGWGLYDSDMDAFNNGDNQSIMYSMGCWTDAYDYDACIAEHFVRNSNGGGVAFIGNSRYGWYNPGYINTLSMLYDQYFFRSIFQQGHYSLGECFAEHKNDSPTGGEINKYIFTELTLMGDPEMPIWTTDPNDLAVSYPSSLPLGYSPFTVYVENGSGGYVENARVCIMKDDEIYDVGYTNVAGFVIFYPSTTTTGTMDITIYKHNYWVYEGQIEITGGDSDLFINMVPDSAPVVVFPGDTFTFTGSLTNNLNQSTTTDVWTMVDVPDVGLYGPISNYNNIPLGPSETLTYEGVQQAVPHSAEPGIYRYISYCGDYDTNILDSSSFVFYVFGAASGGNDTWGLNGWFDGSRNDIPSNYSLSANYPNPFNATTTIAYQLPKAGDVQLEIYNLMGQGVRTLVNSYQQAGTYRINWDASEYSSGIYFYRLKVGDKTLTKRATLLK